MTRGALLLSALLATLAVALPASAASVQPLRGVLVSVSSDAVAIKNAKRVVTTCARTDRSPSLTGYAAGDAVQAACLSTGKRLVLVRIAHRSATAGAPANDAEPTKFAGAVTALTDSSISLHDGDHDLTCSLGASSPATDGVKVGQHFKVTCTNGVLVALAPVTTVDAGHAYEGTVTAISAGSITVHTPHGDGTCTVSDGSPSIAGITVGDRVLAGCKAGTNQLVLLKKLPATNDAPPPPPPAGPHHTTGAAGAVSAVSSTSITVHTDGGQVTCSVEEHSPSVAELHVGDQVKIGCVDGVLAIVARTAPAPPPAPAPAPGPGDAHPAVTVGGTLSALSATSLTVHGEHGDVTCTVGPEQHLGDFHVGDHVGMACVDGALLKLVKL